MRHDSMCSCRARGAAWMSVALMMAVALPAAAAVSNIQAQHRNGQTFVTWMDAETGTAGAKYRYTVYRASVPITPATLPNATPIAANVLPFSGKRFGYAFNMKDRTDASKPMAIIVEGGTPLPLWSGLNVHTASANGPAYYAVVARDTVAGVDAPVVAGANSMTAPVMESVSPLSPILHHTAASVYPGVAVTGQQGLPLLLSLHASSAGGGPPDERSDYYEFFGDASMGYRDGMQTAFGVQEWRLASGHQLRLITRDTLEHPNGAQGFETFWFGYNIVPQGAASGTPARAHSFTEQRLDWMLQWAIARYGADPNRIYAEGTSMGGWGTMSYALRRPERFAALFPTLPRMRQTALPNLAPGGPTNLTQASGVVPLMPDGSTRYFDRMDSVAYVAARHADLPFVGWSIGRQDGYATWAEQLDFVNAMKANHHGFAFAWNNGNHSAGIEPMAIIRKDYPPELFALDKSYPAFANSSIDDDPGNGSPTSGALVGGINLGFAWSDIVDQPQQWSVRLSNRLAQGRMTVDVTPRRLQQFLLAPGEQVSWSNSTGGSGVATADAWGLLTITAVGINAGQASVLTLTKLGSGDSVAPTAPTGLVATAVSSSRIALAWTAASDNVAVTGYRVYRNGTPVAIVATPGHDDTGLAAGTGYSYTVAALDAAGHTSAVSSVANATTLASVPAGDFDFALDNAGPRSVVAGQQVTNTLTASLLSGATQNLVFSTAGLPSGVTASYGPANCSPGCTTTLTLQVAGTAVPGSYQITVSGTAGGITRHSAFALRIAAAGSDSPSAVADGLDGGGGGGCSASASAHGLPDASLGLLLSTALGLLLMRRRQALRSAWFVTASAAANASGRRPPFAA